LSKVPEEVKQVAFHFVRETVTNAVKHANPNNIKVNIFLNLYEDGTYLFEVVTTDDGIGLKTPNFESMGFGLFDLKWSIETRGGELSINRSELGESVLAVAFNGDLSQIEQVSYA
jgi:signal transduction histidine kinase